MIRFSVPSPKRNAIGYILSFTEEDDLNKVKKHSLDMNETDELYTWSFVKDNIILLLPGSMPEESVRLYKNALNNLKK